MFYLRYIFTRHIPSKTWISSKYHLQILFIYLSQNVLHLYYEDSWSMVNREMVDIYSENHTKLTDMLWGQNIVFVSYVKTGAAVLLMTEFQRVKIPVCVSEPKSLIQVFLVNERNTVLSNTCWTGGARILKSVFVLVEAVHLSGRKVFTLKAQSKQETYCLACEIVSTERYFCTDAWFEQNMVNQ